MPIISIHAASKAYAEATLPISSTEVVTSGSGLVEGTATVMAANGPLELFHARPQEEGPWPIILVISEVFGVHAHIADICRRFAKLGFLAVAPELFSRHGDPRQLKSIPEIISQIVAKVPDHEVLADLDAAALWAQQAGGDKSRLAVNGYCWGGRIAWLYAAHNRDVKSAIAWYGRLEGTKSALTPLHPVDVANSLYAPVLGLYAGQDAGIPPDSVERLHALLAHGNRFARESELVVYSDAQHAFFADYRASYHAESAIDGWARCLNWLRKSRVLN